MILSWYGAYVFLFSVIRSPLIKRMNLRENSRDRPPIWLFKPSHWQTWGFQACGMTAGHQNVCLSRLTSGVSISIFWRSRWVFGCQFDAVGVGRPLDLEMLRNMAWWSSKRLGGLFGVLVLYSHKCNFFSSWNDGPTAEQIRGNMRKRKNWVGTRSFTRNIHLYAPFLLIFISVASIPLNVLLSPGSAKWI